MQVAREGPTCELAWLKAESNNLFVLGVKEPFLKSFSEVGSTQEY